jgi:hypothetical protein
MINLQTISLKKRRQAARNWAQWRNAGENDEVTAARAYELSGSDHFKNQAPDRPIRLVEVALRSVTR